MSSTDSNDKKMKMSKKDKFFQKTKAVEQVKVRGDAVFNNFDGELYTYENSKNRFSEFEHNVRKLLDFNFMSKDWSDIQGLEPMPIILFNILLKVDIKVKKYMVDFSSEAGSDDIDPNGSRINISFEIMKRKSSQSKSVSKTEQNKHFFSYLFRDVIPISFNTLVHNIKTKDDFNTLNQKFDDKYKFYLPIIKMDNIDDYLKLRVESECVPIFRGDYKYQIYCLYFSTNRWNELKSVGCMIHYFNVFGFEPFILNKFSSTDPDSLKISHSSIMLVILMNSVLYEDSIYDSLITCGATEFMAEFLKYALSDSPAVTMKQFSDKISNLIRVIMFCDCEEFAIPTVTVDGRVSISTSFVDNLTDYEGMKNDMISWARDNKLFNLIKIITYICGNSNRDSVLLTEFISGIPNITGYTSSDQVEAVKRQIYTGRQILHDKYKFNDDELKNQAEHDWDINKDLIIDQIGVDKYIALRNDYFKNQDYKFDVVPIDFDCNGSEVFSRFSNYLYDFTLNTSKFDETQILDRSGVIRNAFNVQTPNSADVTVKIKVPVSTDPISRTIKLKAQNFSSKHYDESIIVTLKTKRALISVTPMDELLNLDNVFRGGFNKEISYLENLKNAIPYVIRQGNRQIPGPKPIRFIFVVPWSDNMYNQSVGYNGLQIHKRQKIIGKPTGVFLRDYADILRSTSVGNMLNIFLDFSVFDGSCLNYVQRHIYRAFEVNFNFQWNEFLTIGQLLTALQKQKYRCVMILEYAGETYLMFLDMILSGELLTNYKDTLVNYGLIRVAMDELTKSIPELTLVFDDILKLNGDDSHLFVNIPDKYISVTSDIVKARGRNRISKKIRRVNYHEDFKNVINTWADSLPDIFKEIGFKLSDAKGGVQASFAEYLKVWIKFSIIITNWRLQIFVQEKTSVLPHSTMIASLIGLARTVVERGFKSRTLWRYTFLQCLTGRRLTTGTFAIANIINTFNPTSGYSMPLNNKLLALPNTTIFSLYVFMHSQTKLVPNHMIIRYLLNNFERANTTLTRDISKKIAFNKIQFLSTSLNVPPKVNSKEYHETRDHIKIEKSHAAYNQLKDMGFRPSESSAYFNGFVTYIESGLASSKISRAVTMTNFEKANARFFDNINNASHPIGPLTPEMLILSNIIISENGSQQSFEFRNDMTNMAIGSDVVFLMFKYILGYASTNSHSNYERDIVDLIKTYDPTYPRELSQEVLLKNLLKPEILSNPTAFMLTCITLGISDTASEVLRLTLNNNYLLYSVQSNQFNYSSVSQFLNIWEFDVNHLRTVLNLPMQSGELSMVDRLSTLMTFLYLISIVDVDQNIIVKGLDTVVMQGAIDVVAGSRSF